MKAVTVSQLLDELDSIIEEVKTGQSFYLVHDNGYTFAVLGPISPVEPDPAGGGSVP